MEITCTGHHGGEVHKALELIQVGIEDSLMQKTIII